MSDWFWDMTGAICGAHMTYAPGQLAKEGAFSNPARLVEDQGLDPDIYNSVWAHAGWWDKEYVRRGLRCNR